MTRHTHARANHYQTYHREEKVADVGLERLAQRLRGEDALGKLGLQLVVEEQVEAAEGTRGRGDSM